MNRCSYTSDLGLGCARTEGHEGSHWLTSRPQEAREALLRDGFFATPDPCDCGKGEWCPQYGSAFRRASEQPGFWRLSDLSFGHMTDLVPGALGREG